MSEDYDFDLDRKIEACHAAAGATESPAKKVYPKKVYSDDEKTKKLEGYELVPRDQWTSIPVRSHIRYETIDGAFRSGGFVQNHYSPSADQQVIYLANTPDAKAPGSSRWPIVLQKTKSIWIRSEQILTAAPTPSPDISGLLARVAKLEETVGLIKSILVKGIRPA